MATRRQLLGIVGAGMVAACTPQTRTRYVEPSGPQVAAAESARKPGAIREFALSAQTGEVDLGGTIVPTWSYDGQIPGRPIRVAAGEQIRVTVDNRLPELTTVHWHGVRLRNDADGVPDVTQTGIEPGSRYTYQFTASDPGTYWLHPHHGLQLDRGLYAPLIVDDPQEPMRYDREWIVILDDWLDGVAGTPEDVYKRLGRHRGMGMAGNPEIAYPMFLLNGHIARDPDVLKARPGDRIRLRVINAAAATAFRLGVAGHRMTVTHTDGWPVQPAETDSVTIAMGERYDALLTAGSGAFPVVARPIAASGDAYAAGLIRTAAGSVARPLLGSGTLTAADLRPAKGITARPVQRTLRLSLTGGMMAYDWGFDGAAYEPGRISHSVREGERIRLEIANRTMMWHPIHLHGHVFQVGAPHGAMKDTDRKSVV